MKIKNFVLPVCFRAFLFSLILVPANLALAEEKLPIPVVATLPFLKDFVEQIGQNRVVVSSLLTGMESEHTYTPKPSDILSVKNARVLVQVGLGLEIWVKKLIDDAGNSALLVITTSHGIPLIREDPLMLEKKQEAGDDRHDREGGNPHIWLDPENAKTMVRQITEGLIQKDPEGKEFYLKNQGAYLMKLDSLEKNLLEDLKGIKNKTIITQHPAWPYFARRFGFRITGNIIMQVGAEPSGSLLKDLIKKIRKENIRAIVSEPQLSDKIPKMLSEETGIPIVILSPLPGYLPGTETYLKLIEYNVRKLIEVLKK